MTTVVNIKTDRGLVAISRHSGNYVYIGRPSIFGNPFSVEKYGREESIKLYKELFYKSLADIGFKEAVLKLKGKILGCYCKPLACHGDVIVEYLEEEIKKEDG